MRALINRVHQVDGNEELISILQFIIVLALKQKKEIAVRELNIMLKETIESFNESVKDLGTIQETNLELIAESLGV